MLAAAVAAVLLVVVLVLLRAAGVLGGKARPAPSPHPPVAPLPAALERTTPVPGELRGVQGRFFRLVAAEGEGALEVPAAGLLVELYDAAGALIPPAEWRLLSGAGGGAAVPWVAADLRRERSVTRAVFASMDPRLSQTSARASLQVLDMRMRPVCSIPYASGASQRVVFELEGEPARACVEALRRRQETPFTELSAGPSA
jgi:hypothetical protein